MKPNFDPEVEASAEDESEVSSKVSIQEASNDSCCDNLINICNITNPIGIHPNSEAISLDSTLNSMNSEPGERDSIGFSFSSNEPASQTTAPTIPRVFPCNFCQRKYFGSQDLDGHIDEHRRERELAKRAMRMTFFSDGYYFY